MPTLSPAITFTRAVLRHLAKPSLDEIADQNGKNTRSGPPIEKYLYAARMAATIGSTDNARAMAMPLTVTAISTPSQYDRDCLSDFAEYILAGLSDACGEDLITGTKALRAPDRTGSDQRSALDRFHRELNVEIARGKAILAFVSDADDLSDAATCLPCTVYRLSQITGTIITEVMRAMRRAPSRRLANMLSESDATIASLPYSIVIGALQQERPGEAVQTILDAVQRRTVQPVGPRLEDIHLPTVVQSHFNGLVQDIERYRKGETDWLDISSSFLLYGPPGCGKTSFAQALAGAAGLHFVAASFGECQAAGSLHEYLKAMNKKVSEAVLRSPSMFFIDEADTYVARGGDGDRNDIYMMLVVNHMLEVLSRLNKTPGIVVVAATNHPSLMDPALVRAGRFDTHLHIGPPDRNR